MFHAMMRYTFKPEHLDTALELWQSAVKGKIEKQPGFVRVQLYKNTDGEVLALGSWEAKADAERFMQTGVFKVILEALEPYLSAAPQQRVYDLEWFSESGDGVE